MKIFVTGASGFLGGRLVSLLEADARYYGSVFHHPRTGKQTVREGVGAGPDGDLRYPQSLEISCDYYKPDVIIHCAGVVNGFKGQTDQSLTDNLLMGLNVIETAKKRGIRLIMAGSSCMYPVPNYGPVTEAERWLGPPYEGNFGYGIAKRVVAEAGVRTGATTCVFPNLYGPGADDSSKGHLVAGIVKKIKDAKATNQPNVMMLGDGTAQRELLYVDDAVEALIFTLNNKLDYSIINFGTNKEHTIKEIAETVKVLVGYDGDLLWGGREESGQQRKIMRTTYMGWAPKVSLIEGLKRVVDGR